LFWQIGKRINDEILLNKRADYGKQIVVTVSRQLETKYGRSFSDRNLRRMMQFADVFNDFKIVTPLATQLSLSHFIEFFPVKNDEARMFYAQKVIEESWGKRALKQQIERKATSENLTPAPSPQERGGDSDKICSMPSPSPEERDLGRGHTNVTSENLPPRPSPQERGVDSAKICKMPSPSCRGEGFRVR
jgi:hypothetical protein